MEGKRPLSRSYPTWWHLVDPVQGETEAERQKRMGRGSARRGVSRKAEKVGRLIFHRALFPSLVARAIFLGQLVVHARLDITWTEFPKFFLIVHRSFSLFLFLSLLEKHHDYASIRRGPRKQATFSGDEKLASERAGQLEMPWKQNRYLILTKPRPHKRIFSGTRFRNESSRESTPSSFTFRFPLPPPRPPSPFLPICFSSLCLVSASRSLLLEPKYRGRKRERERKRQRGRKSSNPQNFHLSFLFSSFLKVKKKPLTRIRWRKKEEKKEAIPRLPLQRVKRNGDVRRRGQRVA